jgi:hypothetical protein
MKLLRKILKWFLLLVVAVVLTSFIIVMFNWPLWAGFIIFIVLMGVIFALNHLVRKKIYEYKTGFITDGEKLDTLNHSCLARYKAMREQLDKENLKHLSKRIKTLPWMLAFSLDDNELERSVRKYATASTPEQAMNDVGARWYVTEAMAVVFPEQAVYENIMSLATWEHFLEHTSKQRRSAPLNKIIISFSVKHLLDESRQAFLDKVAIIKSRVQQVYQITGYTIPISFVLSDLHAITHGEAYTQQLNSIMTQQAMGVYARSADRATAAGLFDDLVLQLNDYIDQSTFNAAPDEIGALYAFTNEVMTLRANWLFICKQLIPQDTVVIDYQVSGLFLITAKKDEQGVEHNIFARDLVLEVLSKTNVMPSPTKAGVLRSYFKQRYQLYALYIAYAFILVYIVFSFIQTNASLGRMMKSIPTHITYSDNFQKNLIKISNYNALMQNIISYQKHWTLKVIPFHVGLGSLEEKYVAKFSAQYKKQVYDLFFEDLVKFVQKNKTNMTPLQHAYVVENIIESINIIQAKLDGQPLSYIEGLDRPQIQYLGEGDIPSKDNILNSYGKLFKLYVWWQQDANTLRQQKGQLIALINNYDLLNHEQNTNWLVAWANTQSDIKPVTLQDFWHGTIGENSNQVEPAFTQEGSRRIKKLQKEINRALPGYMNLNAQEMHFNLWYEHQRLQAWYHFALYFHRGVNTLSFKSQWAQFFDSNVMLTAEGPYYRLLDVLYNEFANDNIIDPPAWLTQIRRFYGLLDFQVKKNAIDKGHNIAKVTRSFLKKLTTEPAVIQNRSSLDSLYHKEFDTDLDAAQSFLEYQVQLDKLYSKPLNSLGLSYSISKGIYNAKDEQTSADAKIVYLADNSYSKMHKLLSSSRNGSDSVFWMLIRGPFDFYIDYVNRQASCYTQQEWVSSVLKSANGLSGDELTNTLFGKKGIAWQYVSKYIQPFLKINNDLYVPHFVFGHLFPFTDEFYNFVNRGLTIQAIERERKQFEQHFNQSGGRLLSITSTPATINHGATALPYKVELDTVCGNKAFQLRNFNFTISTQLKWKLGQCGPTTLKVHFRTFTLVKSFPGQFGFAHFLRDAVQGNTVYQASDFPQNANNLKAYNITNIQLSYHVQGLDDLNLKLDNFFKLNAQLEENERKYLDNGSVPTDIALCWGSAMTDKVYKKEGASIRHEIARGK